MRVAKQSQPRSVKKRKKAEENGSDGAEVENLIRSCFCDPNLELSDVGTVTPRGLFA